MAKRKVKPAEHGLEPKKWIQGAIKPENKGKFSAKAARAGESTSAYATEHAHDSGTLGKEARLAQTFEKMRKH